MEYSGIDISVSFAEPGEGDVLFLGPYIATDYIDPDYIDQE